MSLNSDPLLRRNNVPSGIFSRSSVNKLERKLIKNFSYPDMPFRIGDDQYFITARNIPFKDTSTSISQTFFSTNGLQHDVRAIVADVPVYDNLAPNIVKIAQKRRFGTLEPHAIRRAFSAYLLEQVKPYATPLTSFEFNLHAKLIHENIDNLFTSAFIPKNDSINLGEADKHDALKKYFAGYTSYEDYFHAVKKADVQNVKVFKSDEAYAKTLIYKKMNFAEYARLRYIPTGELLALPDLVYAMRVTNGASGENYTKAVRLGYMRHAGSEFARQADYVLRESFGRKADYVVNLLPNFWNDSQSSKFLRRQISARFIDNSKLYSGAFKINYLTRNQFVKSSLVPLEDAVRDRILGEGHYLNGYVAKLTEGKMPDFVMSKSLSECFEEAAQRLKTTRQIGPAVLLMAGLAAIVGARAYSQSLENRSGKA